MIMFSVIYDYAMLVLEYIHACAIDVVNKCTRIEEIGRRMRKTCLKTWGATDKITRRQSQVLHILRSLDPVAPATWPSCPWKSERDGPEIETTGSSNLAGIDRKQRWRLTDM